MNGIHNINVLQNPMKLRNNTLYDFFLRETSTGLKQLWVEKILHFLFKTHVAQIYFNAATKKKRKREDKNLPTVTNYKKSTEKIL
jgi:hypothetical protein